MVACDRTLHVAARSAARPIPFQRSMPDQPSRAQSRPGRAPLRVLGRVALLLLVLLVAAGGALWLAAREAMGGRLEGGRLESVERSPQWRDGRFRNRRVRVDGPFV